MGEYLADKQLFGDLLRYLEGGDAHRPISVFIEGATWDFEAQDLKDIFLKALIEAPSLRKLLEKALADVETLQAQNDTNDMITNDMIEEFLFSDLLKCVEHLDHKLPIEIICGDKSGVRRHFATQALDLKNALLCMLIEAPSLRKALDEALADVETLQEQIAGETLSLEPPAWEYKDFFYTDFNTHYTDQNNKMGAEGWELIQCDFDKGHAVFKRPK